MEYISTTFAYGNGPYSRILDLGIAIQERLIKETKEKFPLIIPLVYGDRQKKIIWENFGEIIKKDSRMILLDKNYGEILSKLFFKDHSYQKNLESLIEEQPILEEKLRNYLSGKLELENFEGKSERINGSQISFEISHNPRIATGYKNSFYTSIGLFSEIMEKSLIEPSLKLDPNTLRGCIKIAKKIEDDRRIHFIPEPFVFSYDNQRKKREKEIFTPPFIHPPKINYEKVQKGMYVMITGIDSLKDLFKQVRTFDMKLYVPPFITHIKEADNTHLPDFISNSNIKFQFARTGWSSVWYSHLTRTPFITPQYNCEDDPEIYFNEKTVKKLGIATILEKNRNLKDILKEAKKQPKKMEKLNNLLEENYGILDGINYTAKIISDFLQGKDIKKYRKINPCLNS